MGKIERKMLAGFLFDFFFFYRETPTFDETDLYRFNDSEKELMDLLLAEILSQSLFNIVFN
jgi:hypothetical protein